MNERIKELEKQAFDAVWDLEKDLIGPSTHFRPDGFEEKFSELIVRETIKQMAIQMDKFGDDQSNNPAWYKSEKAVMKHFGVEE